MTKEFFRKRAKQRPGNSASNNLQANLKEINDIII